MISILLDLEEIFEVHQVIAVVLRTGPSGIQTAPWARFGDFLIMYMGAHSAAERQDSIPFAFTRLGSNSYYNIDTWFGTTNLYSEYRVF